MDFVFPNVVTLISQLLLFFPEERELRQREDKSKILKSIR